ncbi:MAG: hypothetical protein QNK37_37520, partial [Acidobacteriota bacterium]|nr:hypothetical protein [Acidobacteriota bacterium]
MAPQTDRQLKQAFQRGLAAARDPAVEPETGLAVTNLRSPWLHQRCEVCHHSFRPDDPVLVDGRKVRHAGNGLNCHNGAVDPEPEAEAIDAFYRGLYKAWPPPEDAPGLRLKPGHTLLDPPVGRLGRHTCAVCAHTLRPGDTVVICPCRPNAPLCQLAIHRDPLRGLTCWQAWNPGV